MVLYLLRGQAKNKADNRIGVRGNHYQGFRLDQVAILQPKK
jgi:hypothetical protein